MTLTVEQVSDRLDRLPISTFHADRKYDLANNPLSVHDINGIYRMAAPASSPF